MQSFVDTAASRSPPHHPGRRAVGPSGIASTASASPGSLHRALLRGIGNVADVQATDPGDVPPSSSTRLLARLATSLPHWPAALRIDLVDPRSTHSIGSPSATHAAVIHVRGDRCFSGHPASMRDDLPGRDFTECLSAVMSDHAMRQVLGLTPAEPLPPRGVIDEQLRLLLADQLHRLLRSDVDVAPWVRSDGSRSLARQAVMDVGLILSTFAAITCVSWAGSPPIAGIHGPAIPVPASGEAGPMAAMLLAGSVTLGMLARLYQAQHRQPMDAHPALIDLLFSDRLNEGQRRILLEKIGPHMATLTPALVVSNVYKRLDAAPPGQDIETTLRRLPVAGWARAAEHASQAFDPRTIGRPSATASAFEALVLAQWGGSADTARPVAERILHAFAMSVPVRASYAEKGAMRQLRSLDRALNAADDSVRRGEIRQDLWQVKHDLAMHRGATAEQIATLRQQRERLDRKAELNDLGRDRYIEQTGLHDTQSSTRGYEVARADVPVLHAGTMAGALTEPGLPMPSIEAPSSMLAGAVAAALRPRHPGVQVAPEAVANVALLSGRAYQFRMHQKALEEALPGWMLADAAERNAVRASLAAYAAVRPAVARLVDGVAALPDRMADHLRQQIARRFGMDIDPRNATVHSQTWRTRPAWDMGAQPVPLYHARPPQKTDVERSLWEVARGNVQADEALVEFRRGESSARHVSISRSAEGAPITGNDVGEWIRFIRETNLGKVAQDDLDALLDAARPALLGSYPLALDASVSIAKLGDLPASAADLLHAVIDKPDERPTTRAGRPWTVSALRLFGAELEAFVFHTDGLGGHRRPDTHADGGVLYLPNQSLQSFSSASELADIVEQHIATPSARALLSERVPLDVREAFLRRAEAAAGPGAMRNGQVELGHRLDGTLWVALYDREKAFHKRNLKALITPTADVDRDATIAQSMALYQALTGMVASFSGLPFVGPALIGANLAGLASAAIDYTQLQRDEGSSAGNALVPDLITNLLSAVDVEPDAPRPARVRGVDSSATPRYFRTARIGPQGPLAQDARGFIQSGRRTYVRLDGDVVEIDASEPARPVLLTRWHEVEVRGPALRRDADGRWRMKPESVESLAPVELIERMLPDEQGPWPATYTRHLVDDLRLDQDTLRGIWHGAAPPSLVSEHMQRYRDLLDLDALPAALDDDASSIPQGMQPVVAQALADRVGRTLELYAVAGEGAPTLTEHFTPASAPLRDAPAIKILHRGGSEYAPMDVGAANQDVPNRLSLIDAVIDAVPTFGVNESLQGAHQRAVRRGQVVDEVVSHIERERAAFQDRCLRRVSSVPAPPVSSRTSSRTARVFPGLPGDLRESVSAGQERAGPFDMGRAGSIVADRVAQARRHDVLFRLQHGPHTRHSESVYLHTLVSDKAWPRHLVVEVIPAALSSHHGDLRPIVGRTSHVYGDASANARRLTLYKRDDGTYAPIASDGRERGSVPVLATHAPDDLGSAVLQAMTADERHAWIAAHATSDLNGWVAERARRLDGAALDARMKRDPTALTPHILADVAPDRTSLGGRTCADDGTYDVDGKTYLHAYGNTYRLKEDTDRAGRYRVVSAGSPESRSPSSTYAGLDFAPLIFRDRHGVWRLDARDRLYAFHKLGAITQGVDVAQARVVLDVTGVTSKQLRELQLGRTTSSPELDDAITRARMRSVIARLSRDAGHFDALQDPAPVLAMLTKLDGWPRDTAIEVSDEDGQVTLYGQAGTTKAVRIALDDLQSPILESLGDLFGKAFLGSLIEEPSTPSLIDKLGKQLSRMAGRYPDSLFNAWYVEAQAAESMLAQELMRVSPGLTRRAAEQILAEEKVTRAADLMPNGRLADAVKLSSERASQATRIHRLAEAVRTGRVVTATEKTVMVDLLARLPGWAADVAIDAGGDIALYRGPASRVIRGDGDGYRVLDAESRVIGGALDVYAATWAALDAADRDTLALEPGEGDALRRAVWKLAEQDAGVFRRHGQAMADAEPALPTLCRVRRMPVASGGCASGAAAVPQAARDAKSAIEAVHALAERSPRPSVSMSSSASGSSVRSQSLGNANLAALVVASDIRLPNRRDKVTFPKLDETALALHQRALVSQSSGGKDGAKYLIFASNYNDASLPKIAPHTSIVDQVNSHNRNGGVSIPGRNFRYQVQLAKGGKLALNRPSDTESAILEYVADQIKRYVGVSSALPNPRLIGKLVIYTELTPCDSCQNIIRQFQANYPGIELDVYFSFKGNRERTITPLADADIHVWQKP